MIGVETRIPTKTPLKSIKISRTSLLLPGENSCRVSSSTGINKPKNNGTKILAHQLAVTNRILTHKRIPKIKNSVKCANLRTANSEIVMGTCRVFAKDCKKDTTRILRAPEATPSCAELKKIKQRKPSVKTGNATRTIVYLCFTITLSPSHFLVFP